MIHLHLIEVLFIIASHGSLPPASSFAISPAASHLPSTARHTQTRLLSHSSIFPIRTHKYTQISKSLITPTPFSSAENRRPSPTPYYTHPLTSPIQTEQHLSVLSSNRVTRYYPHIHTPSTLTIVMILVFFDIGEM